MMEIHSDMRHTGRTTRFIDMMVQQLFENGTCRIIDHTDYDPGPSHLTSVGQRVLDRLWNEHRVRGIISNKGNGSYNLWITIE